ncbi:MAG: exonuclease domain-containing protein [bacterium]|nr:exonuclease domain-containing protein [bacterium]
MDTLNLQLTKPIVFIKAHTTGVKPSLDRIVQLTIARYNPDGTSKTGTRLINPEMPIPAEATKINGISDEMVSSQPTFFSIAQNLHRFIGDADIAGFNVEFDLNFLMEEFARAGLAFSCSERNVIDLQSMYHQLAPRDFIQAASTFAEQDFLRGAPINSESHALNCVRILNGMVEQFQGKTIQDKDGSQKSFNNSATSISETFGKGKGAVDMKGQLVKDDNGALLLNFGKYKGRPLEEIANTDMGYITWILNSDKPPRDTKNIIDSFIKKMNTAQPQ